MYSLLLKDILLNWKRLPVQILFGIFYAMFLSQNMTNVYIGICVMLSVLLLQITVAYDEMNKAEVFINSLPIPRYKVVLARYLSVLFYIIIILGIYGLITSLLSLLGIPIQIDKLQLEGVATVIFTTYLMASIFLPVYYRFGYIKARIYYIAFIIVSFSLPTIFIASINENFAPESLQKIFSWLNSLQPISVFSGVILLTLLIVGLSYLLSVRFYRRREF
jgi:ABC-2 type transport system permease protein